MDDTPPSTQDLEIAEAEERMANILSALVEAHVTP
jgi:hypothetical protein